MNDECSEANNYAVIFKNVCPSVCPFWPQAPPAHSTATGISTSLRTLMILYVINISQVKTGRQMLIWEARWSVRCSICLQTLSSFTVRVAGCYNCDLSSLALLDPTKHISYPCFISCICNAFEWADTICTNVPLTGN